MLIYALVILHLELRRSLNKPIKSMDLGSKIRKLTVLARGRPDTKAVMRNKLPFFKNTLQVHFLKSL
jgi:hypothetical protein